LPRSLKSEVLVRTRVENPEVLENRRNIVQSKSVSELAQVNTLADFPLPTPIEHLIQGKSALRLPKPELGSAENGEGGGPYDIYASLPRSLTKKEVFVRSKIEEDENVLKERQSIVRSKTPAELSQIHSFAEVPLPTRVEAWLHKDADGKSISGSGRSSSIPRNKQEIKEIVYNKLLPEALTRPVVVRSRVEDPEILKVRQNVQQSKSIHELAKIRNLNEFPLPARVQTLLPDLPLPKMKDVIGIIARVPRRKSKTEIVNDQEFGYTPAETPNIPHDSAYTDDEMLRFEMSSPEMSHRDQDFDYEVIEAGSNNPYGFMQTQIPVADTPISNLDPDEHEMEESEISVADHYKGTPPLRTKKKAKNRMSHEIPSEYQLADETTPPAISPPSRPERRNSKDVGGDSGKLSRSASGNIKSGPPRPASSASANTVSVVDQWHSVRSTRTTTDDDTLHTCMDTSLADTLVGSEDLHSCADTLNDQIGSDDEYFSEMLPRDRNSRHFDED